MEKTSHGVRRQNLIAIYISITMQYRTLCKEKINVSALGFGCMRLPTTNGKPNGPVDEKEATRIVRHGIDNGINYVDTAKIYHNSKCEAILGRILRSGYRDKVMIATKLPTWDVKTRKDADRIFDEQRKDLRTDKIDFYLIHNLQRAFDKTFKSNKLAEWAWRKKEKGEIGHVGFSFHDDYAYFEEIVNSFDRWEFCQIQYNYVNENDQAGTKGLQLAASKGLSVIIMEPLLGGALATPSGLMAKLFESKQGERYNPVDLALRWLWNKPEVSLVLSGMSSYEQVVQNLAIADKSAVGCMTKMELKFVKKLQEAYDQSFPIKCTKCRYCLPCPAGVNIPVNFEMYNNFQALSSQKKSAILYKLLYGSMSEETRSDNCAQCGECEENCPQKLPIRVHLAEVHKTLAAE